MVLMIHKLQTLLFDATKGIEFAAYSHQQSMFTFGFSCVVFSILLIGFLRLTGNHQGLIDILIKQLMHSFAVIEMEQTIGYDAWETIRTRIQSAIRQSDSMLPFFKDFTVLETLAQ